MKRSLLALVALIATTAILSGADAPALSTSPTQSARMNAKANGTFDVKMQPQPAGEKTGETVSRFLLDKQYHGDLEALALGEMLATMTAVKGSAGYVAIEKVSGKLAGRTGTFCLQHSGLMARGEGSTTILVIPDSGTGELAGITGILAIKIAKDGTHSYEFDYSLPAK